MRRIALLAAVFLATAGLGPTASAESEVASSGIRPRSLKVGRMDLLPLNEVELEDFRRDHGPIIGRINALQRQVGSLARRLGKRKEKDDAEAKRLRARQRALRIQIDALLARLTDELIAFGVEPALIAYMNKAPTGTRRVQRYTYGLVLLLGDLRPAQRGMFGRVVAQVQAAEHAIPAQRERTKLALEQTDLEPDAVRQVLSTFDRQLQLIEQRFWQLTDFALDEPQRARIWGWLPRSLKRKSQATEHLHALPELTPAQGTRLEALFTEVEAESAPDTAAVRRLNTALRRKDLRDEQRQAFATERGAAYRRLAELRRYAARATREILTAAQWRAYEAIPPRVGVGERRGNFRRVLGGWQPDAGQRARIQAMEAEMRAARRDVRQRAAALRRQGADYGADSPQMEGMQMEMAGVEAEGQRALRDHIGRVLTEVMTPDEVSRWVMGHYGYKR
jgi:hypothetical protein